MIAQKEYKFLRFVGFEELKTWSVAFLKEKVNFYNKRYILSKIGSIQLAKYLKTRQATAWFILQRLRHVEENNFFKDSFEGINEADEMYHGGKEKNRHMKDRIKGINQKDIVFGVVNRDNKQAKAIIVNSANYVELGENLLKNIKTGATLITDEYSAYRNMFMYYKHETVNHSKGEYSKQSKNGKHKTHTNTIEGFWSLVKRTINGTHHWISSKHLQRYLSEMSFRYNTKDLLDSERFNNFLSNTQGRLKYDVLVG